ncbi:glycosyl transferase [Arthrobacter sp. ISL-69]|uniref:glycosyl transferase n=1 Tax=Arthrobacter sp. ISL-69 TaxID=2819113 RepID=UPI001BEA7841|nr:glycosyl transferase [Arthrobacter sp. ISL-69]MBT2538275.1 glycosyl transferase [Arthrobacter sp. ISL-69]
MGEIGVEPMTKEQPLRVLFSFGPSAQDANPYVDLLVRSVSGHAKVKYFSWKFALLGSYDVFHLHWPEALIRRRSLLRRFINQALALLLILRLALFRIPIVRTEHNVRPHEKGDCAENAVLDLLDRRTAAWIVMNEVPTGHPQHKVTLIVHGHYRDCYRLPASVSKKPGKVLNFGLIRPYKGVEDLVAAFKALPESTGLTLSIMGKPVSAGIADSLLEEIGSSMKVAADLRHIPDDELALSVAESELVVLPYQSMHNSGVLLLALSLGTPVLVPKNEITDALAREVGERWVQRFEGRVTPDAILAGSEAVRGLVGSPDLAARNWTTIGGKHFEVYLGVTSRARTGLLPKS